MKILFDIDNTLFYNDVVDKLCDKYGIVRTVKHDLSDLPKHIYNECMTLFSDIDTMCSLQPFNGVVGLDTWLIDKGHELCSASARDNHTMRDGTLKMMNKFFPKILPEDIYLVGKNGKKDIYRTLQPDIIIDDHVGHIVEAIGCGIKHIVMVSNKYTPYNYTSVENMRLAGVIVVGSVEEFFKNVFPKLEI